MSVDRRTIRRVLLTQLAELSSWSGGDLMELLKSGDFVRQIHVADQPDLVLNLRIEVSPDQSACPEGATRLWVNVNDFEAIEAGELFVLGENVFVGNSIISLGR